MALRPSSQRSPAPMEHEPIAPDSRASGDGGEPSPWPHAVMGTLALLLRGLALVGWPGLPAWWHIRVILGAYLFILLRVQPTGVSESLSF